MDRPPQRRLAAFQAPKNKPKPTKAQVDEGIKRFIERANEIGVNDYADQGDMDDIPEEALEELVRREEEDPDNFSIITPETRRRIEEREEAVQRLREKHAHGKRTEQTTPEKSVTFEEAIEAQAKTHGLRVKIPTGNPEPRGTASEAARATYETVKDNLTIYRDPEAGAAPDRLAGRVPMPLSLIDKDALPATPHALLPDPRIVSHPSIQQVVSLVQKFQIGGPSKLYYEADVVEVFCKEMKKRVSDVYELRRSSKCLMCVFFVVTPVFIHCKFARRPEKERGKNAVYSWEGYAFTLLKEETDDGGMEDARPPSTVAADEWI